MITFARATSLFSNLVEPDLSFYLHRNPLNERGGKPFSPSELRHCPYCALIRLSPSFVSLTGSMTRPRASLLDALLSLYHRMLRTLSLRRTPATFSIPRTSSNPLCLLSLTLEPSLALLPARMLTDPRKPPLVLVLEFKRQPEPAVLAASLTAQGGALTTLTLSTLTAADVAKVAAYGRPCPTALRA